MLDRAGLEERFRELWREIRSDHRPVIAPYPERTPPKPWKWDRPLDKAIASARSRRRSPPGMPT